MSKFYLILLTFICYPEMLAQDNNHSCDFIKGLSENSEIECGQLTVPEDHENPEGNKIIVAYVIIKSKYKSKKEPVILLGGGPGVEMISAPIVKYFLADPNPIRETRDIIIYEQRGIGYSSALPDINTDLERIMAANLSEMEERDEMKKMIFRARQKAEAMNIDLAHYNTWQNAHDVGLLMKSLEYPKYNLHGISYGTRLGRKVQDLYPQYIHSVIHNSPALPKGDFIIDRLKNYSEALEKVLNYCEEDPSCSKKFPGLKTTYFETIEKLKSHPISVEVKGQPYYVNAQDAIYYIRRVLYRNSALEDTPVLIAELQDGGGPILKDLIHGEMDSNYNNLMWLSVERNEMYNSEIAEDEIEAVYQNLPLLPAELGLFTAAYIAFKDLHGGKLSEEKKMFRVSEVPTIIMVNKYDPITPPENGYIFMEKLVNGVLYILDEGGHGGGNEDCRTSVEIAFMDNPLNTPDTSCLNLVKR